jgi:hypothetical protein
MKKQNKIKVASELLKNTTNIYIQNELTKYIEAIESNEMTKLNEDLDLRVCHIIESAFDIEGFGIHEIPIYYSYVFSNENKGEWFDLVKFEGVVSPRYIEVDCEYDAETIQEAISKYKF